MKPGIHPDYHPVVFQDRSTGDAFLTPFHGHLLPDHRVDRRPHPPLITVDVTAASHPFWTGRQPVLDHAGQVEKFRRRYGTRPGGSEREGTR